MAKSISRYLADISSTSGVLDGTLSTAAQTNITSLGTLSSLTVSGAMNGTLSTAAQPNITSVGTLSTLAMGGNITRTGDLSLDVSGNIILDAGSGNSISVSKDGTAFGIFEDSSTDFVIRSAIQDKDILFKGNDGGSTVTALTLDMSAAGAATFNAGVTLSGHLDIAYSGANITWGTNYSAIGNIKNSQATLLGNNIKAGTTNNTIIRHANGTDAGTFIGLTYNKGVTFHTGITTTQNSEVVETTNERMRIDATGKVGIGTNFSGGNASSIMTAPLNIKLTSGSSAAVATFNLEHSNQSANIEQRLQFAFLLNASVQRQAERVTATEVQLVANELQDALGGVYGILTTEFQLPYINTKLAMLRQQKLLPELPKDIVKTKIIVGMEALGRASDRIKLLQFMSDLAGTLGAETLGKYINLDNAIKKFAVANQIDTQGLIKSEEQIQQETQQAQQQQTAQQMLADPRVAIEMGKQLANSNVSPSVDGEGNVQLNQGE